MSCPPVYLDEIPAGGTDPELAAALEQVASAPEELPLAPELWERLLSLIEKQARAGRVARDLKSTKRNLTRGWAIVDPAPIQFLAPPSISFFREDDPPPVGLLRFPAVIERTASPWNAPEGMIPAILERPEVRRMLRQRGGLESNWPDIRAKIARILSRAGLADTESEDFAETVRGAIEGRAVDSSDSRLAAILAALELGRKIGRAEILADPDTRMSLTQGEMMERKEDGKAPVGISLLIDRVLDTNPQATTGAVMIALGIHENHKDGKNGLKPGDLFSNDPATDMLLFRREKDKRTKRLSKVKTRGDRNWLHTTVSNRQRALKKK